MELFLQRLFDAVSNGSTYALVAVALVVGRAAREHQKFDLELKDKADELIHALGELGMVGPVL